jgi:CheY-like chemotaxis protein/HPt (histidine-containing phosphotransfer) domain-containing protein
VGNAVKFTDSGEVVVRVSRVQDDPKAVGIRFEVRDTGIGIAPEAREALFRPFTQADGSTTRRFGGTGLGLSIAKELVALMGGEIGVESWPGRGARFFFDARFGRAARHDAADQTDDSLRGVRVLIIDDNPTNREILVRNLERWGMEAEEAEDGASGFERLRDAGSGRPFHVVLLDLLMPGMDGASFARVVGQDRWIPRPKILLLTSVGSQALVGPRAPEGVDAILTKPVRSDQLREAVRRLVRGAGVSETTAGAAREARFTGRVLVVEDNPVNQEVARGLLENLGCAVAVAGDGIEALEALERERYDLVFMDRMMPRMDGIAATVEIRKREAARSSPRLPIVALTAAAIVGEREQCLAAGMDGFVSKPFRETDLEEVLMKWLQSSSPAPTDARSSGATGGPGAIDRAALEALRRASREGEAFVARVVRTWLRDAPQRIEEAYESLASGDLETAHRAIHSMKSASAMVGAKRLSESCRAMEPMVREGTVGPDGLDPLRRELETAARELEDLIGAETR